MSAGTGGTRGSGGAGGDGPIDLVVRGARVFDGERLLGVRDVAVTRGRITAIAGAVGEPGADLAARAKTVVDGTGRILTPGWVDLHTHVDAGRSFWGIDPATLAWATGVTTWVDAGSAGLYGIDDLRRRVAGSAVRVPLLLHASAIGLVGRAAESENVVHFDVDASVEIARAHPEAIRGIKIRLSSYTVGPLGPRPLEFALEIAAGAGLPLMVHIGPGIDVDATLAALRPGDIVTHAFTPSILEPGAADALQAAYERGILLDLGHGSGSFSYAVADDLLARGVIPQSFSSDLHLHSRHGVVGTLNDVVAKLLALGVDLEPALAAVTSGPADALGLPSGRIEPGAAADLALFEIDEDPRLLTDGTGEERRITARIHNVGTWVGGTRLTPRYDDHPPAWMPIGDARRARLAADEDAIRRILLAPASRVEHSLPG